MSADQKRGKRRPGGRWRVRHAIRALRGKPPELTLAMMSRVSKEVRGWPAWEPKGHPYGGVVDTVLDTLVRAQLIVKEPGYFGAVPAAALPDDECSKCGSVGATLCNEKACPRNLPVDLRGGGL